LATDLDGTFWGPNFVPPAEHVDAAKELACRGVTVLAATSRRPRMTKQRLGNAGLLLPCVLLDGAIGIDFRTDERFHEAVFGPQAASEVLAAFQAHGLDPCLYVDDPLIDVAVSRTPSTCVAHLERLDPLVGTRDLADSVATMGIYAFSVLGLDRRVLAPLAAELEDGCDTTVVLYPEPVYGNWGLVVNPQGVSKWSGIEAYCARHRLATEEVAAVGDGLNDVAMLRQAAVRIGVRGGCDEIVEMADALIDPPEGRGWQAILGLLNS